MDQVSAGDISSQTVRARRERTRSQARALSPVPSRSAHFQTPRWLDHSIMLPVTEPEAVTVPAQSVPHHDDDAELAETAAPAHRLEVPSAYVRPPTRAVDYARVMKRSDLGRASSRALVASGGMAGLVLILYLLTSWPVVLGMAIAFGLTALAAAVVRVRLAAAPLPYLDH